MSSSDGGFEDDDKTTEATPKTPIKQRLWESGLDLGIDRATREKQWMDSLRTDNAVVDSATFNKQFAQELKDLKTNKEQIEGERYSFLVERMQVWSQHQNTLTTPPSISQLAERDFHMEALRGAQAHNKTPMSHLSFANQVVKDREQRIAARAGALNITDSLEARAFEDRVNHDRIDKKSFAILMEDRFYQEKKAGKDDKEALAAATAHAIYFGDDNALALEKQYMSKWNTNNIADKRRDSLRLHEDVIAFTTLAMAAEREKKEKSVEYGLSTAANSPLIQAMRLRGYNIEDIENARNAAYDFVKYGGKVIHPVGAAALTFAGSVVGGLAVGAIGVTQDIANKARANPKTAAALVAAGGLAATGASLGTSPVIAASAAVTGHAAAASVAATGAAAHASTLATGAAFQAAGGAVMGSIGAAGVGSGIGIPAVAVLMYANKNKLTRSIPAAYHALAYMTAAIYEGSAHVTNSMARFANHATREAKIYHQLHNEVNGAQLTLDRELAKECTKEQLKHYNDAKKEFEAAIKDSLKKGGKPVDFDQHETALLSAMPGELYENTRVVKRVTALMDAAAELQHIVEAGQRKDERLNDKSESLHDAKTGATGKRDREAARDQMAASDYRNFNTLMDSWGKFSTQTARSLYDRMAPVAQQAELEINRDAADLQALYKRANRVNETRAQQAKTGKEEGKSVKLFRANEGSMAENYIPLSREEAKLLAESLRDQNKLNVVDLNFDAVEFLVDQLREGNKARLEQEFARGAAKGELTDLSREDIHAVYRYEAQNPQAENSQKGKSIREIILEDRIAKAKGITGRAYDGMAAVGNSMASVSRGMASVVRRGKKGVDDVENNRDRSLSTDSDDEIITVNFENHSQPSTAELRGRNYIEAWGDALAYLTGAEYSNTLQGKKMKDAREGVSETLENVEENPIHHLGRNDDTKVRDEETERLLPEGGDSDRITAAKAASNSLAKTPDVSKPLTPDSTGQGLEQKPRIRT